MTKSQSPVKSNISQKRIEFLIESSRTSHAEMMFRIEHRDNWLKIQLLAQVAMLALAFGIEIGGIKATSAIPNVIALAIPTSFILACLYVVEDNLVGLLTKERAKLSSVEAQMFPSESKIIVFEDSDALEYYRTKTLLIRFAAQLVAFTLIPAGLAAYRFETVAGQDKWYYYELYTDAILLLLVLWLTVWAFLKRRSMKQIKKIPVIN